MPFPLPQTPRLDRGGRRMPRLRVCGQFETVREGHSGTFNAFGSLSSWRRPCFAGFVSRSAPVSEMYMFPSASRVTSVGPHKPAFVAGPPSPSFEPPSPATVVSFGFGFEAPSSPPIAPQPANTTPQIRSAAIDLVDNTMGRLMRGPTFRKGWGEACKAELTASRYQ